MPKKIPVDQLRVGMYLCGMEGRWLDHPFWRTRFLIRDEATLAKLRASGLRECSIDPSKGEDWFPPLPGEGAHTQAAEQPVAALATTADDEATGQAATTSAPNAASGDAGHPAPPPGLQTPEALDPDISAAFGLAPDASSGEPTPLPAPGATGATAGTSSPAKRARRQVMSPAEQAFADALEQAAQVLTQAVEVSRRLQQQAAAGQSLPVADAQAVIQAMLGSLAQEPSALISLARLKPAAEYAERHPVAVAALMLALSAELGLDPATTEAAGLAGLVHDIGDTQLPASLLQHPGRLDDGQMAQIHTHVAEGVRLLAANAGWPPLVSEACQQHHEKLDGTGYPAGLAGEAIGRLARMLAVCDVYDALSSNRPYQHGLEPAEVIARISASKNVFDAAIVSAFVRRLGLYPVGSLVEMESERLAVVLWQNAIAMSDPVVRVFFDQKTRSRLSPELIDVASPTAQDFVLGRVSSADWPVGNIEALWSHGHAARILGPGAQAGRAALSSDLRD